VAGINQNIQPEENRLSWLMGCYFQIFCFFPHSGL